MSQNRKVGDTCTILLFLEKKKCEGGWGEWFSDNTREEMMEGVDSQESLLARS